MKAMLIAGFRILVGAERQAFILIELNDPLFYVTERNGSVNCPVLIAAA
jgi:hypothetical protein